MTQERRNGWAEYLRFITPILITIAIFMLSNIQAKINDVDEKMFEHLTNDEIHCPKTLVVTKAEFSIYQEMRQRQMEELKTSINTRIDNLRSSVDKIIEMLDKKH